MGGHPRRPEMAGRQGEIGQVWEAPVPGGAPELILSARRHVAQTVNAGLTMLYSEIGGRIRRDILDEKWASYGKKIVSALWRQLGWSHFKPLIPPSKIP
jgi:hypothetical protein